MPSEAITAAVVAVVGFERYGFVAVRIGRARARFAQQNLHFLFGLRERCLTRAGELHATLELLQRIVERQIAAFEFLHDGFEFGKGGFEIRRLGDCGGIGFGLGHVKKRS